MSLVEDPAMKPRGLRSGWALSAKWCGRAEALPFHQGLGSSLGVGLGQGVAERLDTSAANRSMTAGVALNGVREQLVGAFDGQGF